MRVRVPVPSPVSSRLRFPFVLAACLIGVIVSLVKIAAMATVVLGIAFWAYAAFSICFTLAVVSLDRFQCWEMIESMEPHQ